MYVSVAVTKCEMVQCSVFPNTNANMSEHLGMTSFPQAYEHIVELGYVELLCRLLYELYEDAKYNKYNI